MLLVQRIRHYKTTTSAPADARLLRDPLKEYRCRFSALCACYSRSSLPSFWLLYGLQRREMRAVEQLSHQLQRIAIGGRLEGRVELHTDHPEISALGTAINHLLTRSSGARLDRERPSPELFAELADRIHEAVIVHRDWSCTPTNNSRILSARKKVRSSGEHSPRLCHLSMRSSCREYSSPLEGRTRG